MALAQYVWELELKVFQAAPLNQETPQMSCPEECTTTTAAQWAVSEEWQCYIYSGKTFSSLQLLLKILLLWSSNHLLLSVFKSTLISIFILYFFPDWTRVPCPQSQLWMDRREGHLVPANGQPVLPCRALLLASQWRPLLRAVPITCPQQDQQYSHRLITDRQTDRCTDTGWTEKQNERHTQMDTE